MEKHEEALVYKQEILEMKRGIYKREHEDIAGSLTSIGTSLVRLGRYKEALDYAIQALDMYNKLLPAKHSSEKLTDSIYELSLLGLGNQEMLLNNLEMGFYYYLKIGINNEYFAADISGFADETSKLGLSNLAISCYEVLSEKLLPQNIEIKINLARLYHVQALKEIEKGQNDQYIKLLFRANSVYEIALSIGSLESLKINLYIEYSMFLLKCIEQEKSEKLEKAQEILQKAIKLKNDHSKLIYYRIGKMIVCEPLKELLNQYEAISITTKFLAYYLLAKVHLMHSQYEKAKEVLVEFEAVVLSVQGTKDAGLAEYLYDYSKKELKSSELQREQAATMIQKSWREYIKKRESEVSVAGQTIH